MRAVKIDRFNNNIYSINGWNYMFYTVGEWHLEITKYGMPNARKHFVAVFDHVNGALIVIIPWGSWLQ